VAAIFPGWGVEVHDTPIITPTKTVGRGTKKKTKKLRSGYNFREMHALVANLLDQGGGRATAVLEGVHAMPTNGVIGNFVLGIGRGAWEAILASLEIPYVCVDPAAWKRSHGLLGQGKEASLVLARTRFPSVAMSHLHRKKDSDRAEALLLAGIASKGEGFR
jgi:hypothetical protein